MTRLIYSEHVSIGVNRLPGFLDVPQAPRGMVIFAHGSGSGRHSPRNNHVAAGLHDAGFGTLLLDLLDLNEEADRRNVFNIPLLAERLAQATEWVARVRPLSSLAIGYFGASTGAGAAIMAAAQADGRIRAIVSRGGRPDLAGEALDHLHAPTLLIVGGLDTPVIALNRAALARMPGEKKLVIIPGAGHLFEEPGTLDRVIVEAARWFDAHLPKASAGADHATAQC